jgi:hypothetical protein
MKDIIYYECLICYDILLNLEDETYCKFKHYYHNRCMTNYCINTEKDITNCLLCFGLLNRKLYMTNDKIIESVIKFNIENQNYEIEESNHYLNNSREEEERKISNRNICYLIIILIIYIILIILINLLIILN